MGEASELVIERPSGQSDRIFLEHDRYSLGRSPINDLAFPDDVKLSREHLVFERGEKGWSVRDVGSRNGTKLNGLPLSGAKVLFDGDHISAGHQAIQFHVPGTPRAATVSAVEGSTVSIDLQTVLANATSSAGYPSLRNEHFSVLVRAGRELVAQSSVDALCTLVLELAADVSKAARGALFTCASDGALVSRAVRGDELRISTAVKQAVVHERKSLLIRDARIEQGLGARESIVAQDIRSILAAPLQTDENVIGLIYLDSPFFIREFTADDLNVVTVLANIAAIRIEHAREAEEKQARRLMDQDLARAAEIQGSILSAEPPPVPGCDLAAFNLPCRTVGGDYYHFIAYPDGRLAVFVGDVSGKGLPAALLVSSLHACIRLLFDEPPDSLSDHVCRLNRTVSAVCPRHCFITFFAGLYDPSTGAFVYCNAGHNPPLLLKPDGAQEWLSATGMPLGLFAAAPYAAQSFQLEAGDKLLLYSDGATEACAPDGNEEFGEKRLAAAVSSRRQHTAKELLSDIKNEILSFTGGSPPADDLTLVVLQV